MTCKNYVLTVKNRSDQPDINDDQVFTTGRIVYVESELWEWQAHCLTPDMRLNMLSPIHLTSKKLKRIAKNWKQTIGHDFLIEKNYMSMDELVGIGLKTDTYNIWIDIEGRVGIDIKEESLTKNLYMIPALNRWYVIDTLLGDLEEDITLENQRPCKMEKP